MHFPKWHTFFSTEHHLFNEPINGTQIRDSYFESPGAFFKSHLADMLPDNVVEFMENFSTSEEFKDLREEWVFLKEYKKMWEVAPYPPTFVTGDAVCIQSGHVLLIQRKFSPGKHLWAIPGGFLNDNEKISTCQLRELKEETKLKVPDKVLEGSRTYEKVFDSPNRSERGRTITHAVLFELKNDLKLPKVKASDDAQAAKWFTFAEFEKMAKIMYEDHFDIITHMITRSKA